MRWAGYGPAPIHRSKIRGMNGMTQGTCPECQQGELISISMTVSGSDLSFTTCHMCEAKWWYRDGDAVPLQNVIGSVLAREA